MDDEGQEAKKAANARKPRAKREKSSTKKENVSAKGKPWTFPKNTLEDAIRIPKEIEEKNAGNPMPAADLAIAVGYRQSNDWRFLDLVRSANQYGLVTGTGASASISLTKLGQDVVAPSSPHQRSEALLAAFRSVKDFELVEKFYGGKRIPEDEFFINTLTREFNIPRDRVDVFASTFLENLKYLRAFSPSTSAAPLEAKLASAETTAVSRPAETVPGSPSTRDIRIREFLDTCFVMMPFGQWFDRYYRISILRQSRKQVLSLSALTNFLPRGVLWNKFGSKYKKLRFFLPTYQARMQTFSTN